MNKGAFLFITLIFSSMSFAKNTEITLSEGELVLVKIENKTNQLQYSYVNTLEQEIVNTITSPQEHFQSEYLVLGPVDEITTFQFTLPSTATLKIQPIRSEDELITFAYYLSAIHLNGSSLHNDLIDSFGLSLPFHLEQNLAHNLAYSYKKTREIDKLVGILKNDSIDLEQKIVLSCWVIQEKLTNFNYVDDEFIVLIARLAESIVFKSSRDGSGSNYNADRYLHSKTFQDSCGFLFLELKKQNVTTFDLTEANWTWMLVAEKLFESALKLSNLLDEKLTTARVLTHYWSFYNATPGGNANAGKIAEQALRIMEGYPEYADEIAQLLIMKYSILRRQGQFADIRDELDKALSLLDDLSPHYYSTVLFTAGHFYKYVGEFDISVRFFSKALDVFKKNKELIAYESCETNYHNTRYVGKIFTNLSDIEGKLNNFDLAEKYILCANSMLSNTFEEYRFSALIEQAEIKFAQGEEQTSKSIVKKVLLQNVSEMSIIDSLILLIEISINQEDIEGSKLLLKRLQNHLDFKIKHDSSSPELSIDEYPIRKVKIHVLIMRICETENNKSCIEKHYHRAQSILRNSQAKMSNPQAWYAARYNLIEQVVSSELSSDSIESAKAIKLFELLEQSYSLNIEQDLKYYQPTNMAMGDDRTSFEKWMHVERSLLLAKDSEREYLRHQADLAKTRYFEVTKEERGETVNSFSKAIDIRSIQGAMRKNQLVVRYFIGERNSFAIDFTKSNIRYRTLPSRQELSRHLGNISHESNDINWGEFLQSNVLKQLLPLDLLEGTVLEQLIIIPDFILHRIPFSAINIAKNNDEYEPLALKTSVVRISNSTDYFTEQSFEKPKDEPNTIALFSLENNSEQTGSTSYIASRGLTNALQKLPPLPGAIEEVRSIGATLDGYKYFNGLGEKATKQFLMSSATRKANILHIATHGILDPDFPDIIALMTSGSLLSNAEPGYITLNELMSKEFNNDLVVISGCDTMIGKLYNGSGMRSLTRGFLTQGAGAVIGTLWSVPDKATAKFMKLFYSNLKSNSGNIALALNQTKQTFAKSARYKNPKYWAGFVLTSSNQEYENFPKLQ